jgi:AraC family transcriptional activator FtrA
MDHATDVSAHLGSLQRPRFIGAGGPALSRGRDKHVIAVLVVPDGMPLELLVTEAVFGAPIKAIADIMGTSYDSPYEVVLCGEARRHRLARNVDMGDLAPLDTLAEADTVLVPGIAEPLAPRGHAVLQSVRTAYDAGARVVSMCGGAFILGQAGVLDGRRATTHWLLAPEFRRLFPRVRLDVDRLYIDDPPVHTSGGIFAATDLALHILALDCGQVAANDASRLLVSAPHRSGGQAQFIKDSMRRSDTSEMDPVLGWIRENLGGPLTLGRIAAQAHLSERTLVRKFRAATGTSVLEWVIRERLNRAKVLLEATDFPVGEVAMMSGFGSTESMRRQFEKSVGTTAGAYRRTFRTGPGEGRAAGF